MNDAAALQQPLTLRTRRMRMLDGFNQGWIEFAGPTCKWAVALKTVLKDLLAAKG